MLKYLTLLLGLFLSLTAYAQERADWLDIEVGKSVVLETPQNATVIAVTDPTVADVIPMAAANKMQIQGKDIGTTDLVIQLGPGSEPIIYEVTVHQDLADLIRRVDAIVDGEPPRVYPLRQRIVIQGEVPDLETLEQVVQIAQIYDENFVNLMRVAGDHQVQLEVVFAEVSRTGLRELGLNFIYGDNNLSLGMFSPNLVSTVVEHQSTDVINAGMVPSGAAGAFQVMGWISAIDLGAVLSVLDDYRLSKVLAQPTMVCLSGQEAEFLAGGEIPVPAPSGNGTISVEFKEYGVKLAFVPTVLANDVIDTQVHVEMSEPDYVNSSRIVGIEVPGFSTRKAKSHVRLQSGMTFALAGLLDDQTTYTRAEFPGLARIPVVGALFRYTKHTRDEKELMIFVTPRLVRPMGPGEIPAIPGTTVNNNPTDLELFFLGQAYRSGTQPVEPTGAVGLHR